MGSGEKIQAEGEDPTQGGDSPEPISPFETSGDTTDLTAWLKTAPTRTRLEIARFRAERLINAKFAPDWLVYALAGLPMRMTWLGRPKDPE